MQYQVKVREVTVSAVPGSKTPETKARASGKFTVDGSDEDEAKKAARAALKERGYSIRSLSWAPGSAGVPQLLAYVTKVSSS